MKHSIKKTLFAVGLIATVAGCDELLQVSNPNNVAGDDVLIPSAASAMVNGALSGVARGYSRMMTPYSNVTDEMEWSGSRDAYQELDFGTIDNPFNEFTDSNYPYMTQGNWMAREAIRILTIHQGDGTLPVATDLDRAHLYLAISLIQIGNMFDDWTFSDRSVAAAPVGTNGMVAATFGAALTSLAIAAASPDGPTATAALFFRAQAEHSTCLWSAARNQSGSVTCPAANTAAAAALAATGDPDYTWDFEYDASTTSNSMAGWINSRQENRFALPYATPDVDGNPTFDAIDLKDLIDVATVSPGLLKAANQFTSSTNYPPFTIVSAREMHLIMAEHESASGNTPGFATSINAVRALDGLTAWTAGSGVSEDAMLQHHRSTDMFLQGRRLTDMYRWGLTSPQWQAGTTAVSSPGTFFPLTVSECAANEFINNTCS